MDIALQEQELRDNYIESIRVIIRGFVINVNHTTNTDTIVSSLMDSYHERLLKHTHIDQYQFNEAYKSKHMITTFTPAPPVLSTFVQAAWLAAQRQAEQDKWDANDGNNIGTQEDSHQPQQVTFD